jgi:hypothetical protein
MRRRQTRAKGSGKSRRSRMRSHRTRRTRKQRGGEPIPNSVVQSSNLLKVLAQPVNSSSIVSLEDGPGVNDTAFLRYLPVLKSMVNLKAPRYNSTRTIVTSMASMARLSHPVPASEGLSDEEWKDIGTLADWLLMNESVLKAWCYETLWRIVHGSTKANLFDMTKPNSILYKLFYRILSLQDEKGYTPLLFAVYYEYYDIANTLIAAGVELDIPNNLGMTALAYASLRGRTDLAETLIQAGADVNIGDKEGKTPLMKAVINNHVQMVRTLLAAGADRNLSDRFGRKAIDIANDMAERLTDEIRDLLMA